MVQVKIVNNSGNELPKYATELSSGMDLRANDRVTLNPGERRIIRTGLHIQLPQGYEGQVRGRSGLAIKHGIAVLNAPGTIDADYTGEIGVILANLGSEVFEIAVGDRIAQLVISPVAKVELVTVSRLDETERGDGGYGHSGVK